MGFLEDIGWAGTRKKNFTVKVTSRSQDPADEAPDFNVANIDSPDRSTAVTQVDDFDIGTARALAASLDVVQGMTRGAPEEDPDGADQVRLTGRDYEAEARRLGLMLGDLVLPGGYRPEERGQTIRERMLRFHQSLGKKEVLRLNLWLPQELRDLPWEFLAIDSDGPPFDTTPLCKVERVAISRYVEFGRPPAEFVYEAPIRILGVAASPDDLEPIPNLEDEKERLEEFARKSGVVEVEWLEHGTQAELKKALEDQTWHILHFSGHGSFRTHSVSNGGRSATSGEAALYLNGDAGGTRSDPLRPGRLVQWLNDHSGAPTFVVLNSCEGAKGSWDSRASSMAESLAKGGCAGVVAMQYEISVDAAVDFSTAFYEQLGKTGSVDRALTGARTSVASQEWVTPVFYSQNEPAKDKLDLRLFWWAMIALVLVGAAMGSSVWLSVLPVAAMFGFGRTSQFPTSQLSFRALAGFSSGIAIVACIIILGRIGGGMGLDAVSPEWLDTLLAWLVAVVGVLLTGLAASFAGFAWGRWRARMTLRRKGRTTT